MTNKLQVQHMSKIFGPKPKTVVPYIQEGKTKEEILEKTGHTVGVYDVSFDVKEGEFFVIMGLSGSGKSTLIRCFNLLNEPTSGNILIDGENIVEYDTKQLQQLRQNKIAMVFQHFGLFSHRTIIENVEYGLEIKGLSKKERRKIALEQIESVGLAGYEDQYPDQLSGGMQQRVGIARALTNNPDILLMDEPFSALDPLIRYEMQRDLLQIQKKLKKTIIFITHDIDEAVQLGDRVAVMKDGQIVQIDTPQQLILHPANDYIASFTKAVDRANILQAEHLLVPLHENEEINEKLPTIAPQRSVKDVMKKLIDFPAIYVVKNERRIGKITTATLLETLTQTTMDIDDSLH